ncbi:MAG TPA: CheR family methyltransferase [Vicinamibacterales bacterium]|nr:CheR family methyltransferase [Vicinamibacterales bacterium]
MAPHADGLGLSTSALPLLRDLIHERAGLFYDDARLEMLADRVSPLVVERGFDSFIDYYYLLKYDDAAAGEWGRLMDALSVPETYFWREIDQVQAVVTHVVPALLAAAPSQPIRICSLPCATGEEPLTIAMALEEAGLFSRARIEIHAADASAAAIAKARGGRFRQRAFRSLPPALQARYFTRDGDQWIVQPSLQRRITSWSVVNLLSEAETAAVVRAPIVFCRNLFIYFSPAAIVQAVAQFERAMPTPGYLCLGASESLMRLQTRFELQEIGGAFVYVKR